MQRPDEDINGCRFGQTYLTVIAGDLYEGYFPVEEVEKKIFV